MAEKQPRPNDMGKAFAGIVDRLTSEATQEERERWQGEGFELSGFKGEIGKKIKKWQAEGLGKIVGLPLTRVNTYESLVDKNGAYSGLLYALPLSDENAPVEEKKVLLVVPNDTGYDVGIAVPRQFTKQIKNSAEQHRETQNKLSEVAFDTIYTPSDEPYVHKGPWKPHGDESPYETLKRLQVFFSMAIIITPESLDAKAAALEDGVKLATKWKEQRKEGTRDLLGFDLIDNQTTIWKEPEGN